jgi:hypothetical protein
MVVSIVFGLIIVVGFAALQLYNTGKSVFDR